VTHLLIVDDDVAMGQMLRVSLERRGFVVTTATTGEDALAALETGELDVVVTDLNMRGMNGLDLCRRVVADRPDVPVVLITAFGSLDTAIGAIRAGAYDFIPKPFELDALVVVLERAAERRALRAEVSRLRRAVAATQRFDELVGTSPAIRQVYDVIERLEGSEAPALITGESGSGKELVARALHRRSRRASGPFVAINCAALPETLLESELFGHVKGAFTDARAARTGLFVQAGGGTLFLDEIAELPMSLQPKLLRALQERVVRPLGADHEIPFDARLVAATNQDLEAAIADRRFREDLYYRIQVVHLELPPLRARGNDVLLLAQHFLERAAAVANKRITGFLPETAGRLRAYPWPGNVRELQNCIERAVAMARFELIGPDDLPARIREHRRDPAAPGAHDDPEELVPLAEVERRYIERVLSAVGGNKKEAARILGVDRTTLYRKLARRDPA